MSPCRRQPARSSQVCGRATAGRSAGGAGHSAHPSNQRPDEAGSTQSLVVGVVSASLRRVLSRVEQHVAKRGSHFARRTERPVVIATVEHRSPPIEDAIHGPREARRQALHPLRQGRDALGFDEQVDVIVLERVVDDAEVRTLRDREERALHFANQAQRSQRRHVAANANRHQTRMALRKLRPPAMPYPRSRRSLSPSTFPRPAPTHRHLQVQLELRSTRHTLDCGHVLVEKSRTFSIIYRAGYDSISRRTQSPDVHRLGPRSASRNIVRNGSAAWAKTNRAGTSTHGAGAHLDAASWQSNRAPAATQSPERAGNPNASAASQPRPALPSKPS